MATKVPAPPYDPPSKLGNVPPLSAAQRSAIIRWLETWNKDTGLGPDAASLSHSNDTDLLAVYVTIVNDWHDTKGGTTDKSKGELQNNPVTGPFVSVIDFLNNLANPHLWVRILEVVIGAALVAVGAAKMSGAANSVVRATPLGKVL